MNSALSLVYTVPGVCCSGFIFQYYHTPSATAGGVTPSFSGVHQLKRYQNSTATCLCDLSINYHLINNHVNPVHIEYDLHKVKEFKLCMVNDCTRHNMCLSCNFVTNVHMSSSESILILFILLS